MSITIHLRPGSHVQTGNLSCFSGRVKALLTDRVSSVQLEKTGWKLQFVVYSGYHLALAWENEKGEVVHESFPSWSLPAVKPPPAPPDKPKACSTLTDLRALLKSIEWEGDRSWGDDKTCPACGETSSPHDRECWLAAELEALAEARTECSANQAYQDSHT